MGAGVILLQGYYSVPKDPIKGQLYLICWEDLNDNNSSVWHLQMIPIIPED